MRAFTCQQQLLLLQLCAGCSLPTGGVESKVEGTMKEQKNAMLLGRRACGSKADNVLGGRAATDGGRGGCAAMEWRASSNLKLGPWCCLITDFGCECANLISMLPRLHNVSYFDSM